MSYNTNFQRLDDAIEALMDSKRKNPAEQALIYPIDDDIAQEWDDKNRFIGLEILYTNIPAISSVDIEIESYTDIETCPCTTIENIKDLKRYIETWVDAICGTYGVDRNAGWEIAWLDDIDDFSMPVYICIVPDYSDKVSAMIADYNSTLVSAGFESMLSIDENLMMITGSFIPQPDRGNFFEKRRIRKTNARYYKLFADFLSSLHPFMRSV